MLDNAIKASIKTQIFDQSANSIRAMRFPLQEFVFNLSWAAKEKKKSVRQMQIKNHYPLLTRNRKDKPVAQNRP